MPTFDNGVNHLNLPRPGDSNAAKIWNFTVAPQPESNAVDEVVVGVHLQMKNDDAMGFFFLFYSCDYSLIRTYHGRRDVVK